MRHATCAACGAVFSAERRREVCSKKCRMTLDGRNRRAKRKAEGLAKPKPYTYGCAMCGTEFQSHRSPAERERTNRGRYCSPECCFDALSGCPSEEARRRRTERREDRPRRRRAEARLATAAAGTSGSSVWIAGKCARCAATMTIRRRGNLTRFCSTSCKQKAKASRRRAQERRAFVEDIRPVDVFERDGWRCQLCRKPVKRTAVVPHRLAPVVDHIFPLAAGGLHEMRNVQCAHFICNSIKSDRPANDQLRLVG